MKKNTTTKSYSNLDLKLLDVKFIAIQDRPIYLTQALQEVRKTKISELPSLLKPISKQCIDRYGESTLDQSNGFFNSYSKHNKTTIESSNNFQQSILSNKFRVSQFSCVDEPKGKSHFRKSNLGQTSEHQENNDQVQILRKQIRIQKLNKKRQKSENHSMPSLKQRQSYSPSEQQQLEKYRKKIQKIKKENSLIHKEISYLYQNKINQNKEPLKKVKKIVPFKLQEVREQSLSMNPYEQSKIFTKQNNELNMKRTFDYEKLMKRSVFSNTQNIQLNKKLTKSPQLRQKLNFYQNLPQKTPYKQELQNVHKKIISNNLHKNFQQYLLGANKRIPEFIKKLRN